jgi:tetratricopeptide (TPR) repeat protein
MKVAGLRSRWPRWSVPLYTAAAITTGGAAALAKWPHARWWLVVVVVAAAAALPLALAALLSMMQRRREISQTAQTAFQGTAVRGGSELPAAKLDVLKARVHQTILPIPYIHRDAEDMIRAHLHERRPVLLIGPSMVGKTRMAVQFITEELKSRPLAVPDNPAAFAELDAKDVTLQNSVIWLDDIDRLIGTGGITDGALRRLVEAGNTVVATIRARAYDQFRPSDQARPPQWDVLSIFERVFISRDLSQAEQDRLAAAITDRVILKRIRAIGLGEYAGGAGQVAEALKLGAAGADSLGYALLLAAADWRRCGMTRPVSSDILTLLAEPYLDQQDRERLNDHDTFNGALAWATRDINPRVSLLRSRRRDSYILDDYALDLISAQDRPIPAGSWAVIMAAADGHELLKLGHTADRTYHKTETAIEAYRQAIDTSDPDVAPYAAFSMAMLLKRQGNHQDAKAVYKRMCDASPRAALDLGVLLAKQGVITEAKAAYQEAINSGHPDVAPAATLSLGTLLEDGRAIEEAKAAYRQALNSRHPDIAPEAAVRLGTLLKEQGDTEEAKAAYQQAIDSNHPDVASQASLELGELLESQWMIEEAEAAYRHAINSTNHRAAENAEIRLKHLLENQERIANTKAALQRAIDSGNDDKAAWEAANKLESLLYGDVDSVKAVLQKVIDSGYPDAAPIAAFKLGYLLHGRDHEGAKAAYQHAIDSRHDSMSYQAAINLGSMLDFQEDIDGAKMAYRYVIDSGRADYAWKAAVNLGEMLERRGDLDGAEVAYRQAINLGGESDPEERLRRLLERKPGQARSNSQAAQALPYPG